MRDRFTPKADVCGALAYVCLCQKRTSPLFDNLVDSLQQRRWNCESERLRSLVVDDQLETGRLSQRQLTRPSAIQNFCNLLSRGRIDFGCSRAIGHETAGVDEKTERVHTKAPTG